jgi:hypothetical protein
MPEYMERDEWRFLLADFRAAQWCIECPIHDVDDETLLRKFLSLHQFFMRNINRERPDLFAGIADAFMTDVVRKWVLLYRQTLDALRTRFPRNQTSRDLKLGGVNWSEVLGISYEGLLTGASHSSRYAEYWAEKSLKSRSIYETYDARAAFIATPDYWTLFDLANAKQLIVVDQLVNAVPWFDLVRISCGAADGDEIRRRCAAHQWRVDALSEDAVAALLAARTPERAATACPFALPAAAFSGCPHHAR